MLKRYQDSSSFLLGRTMTTTTSASEDHRSHFNNHNDNDSYAGSFESTNAADDPFLQHEQPAPIVVAYVFGPKKMKSMGLVMAEASRVPVIYEEAVDGDEDEDEAEDDQDEEDVLFHKHMGGDNILPLVDFTTTLTCLASGQSPCSHDLNQDQHGHKKKQQGLTKAALYEFDSGAMGRRSTIITLGENANETNNLKHIIRYFQSSCSSAASGTKSMSETTVSTPTTFSSRRSASQHTRRRRRPMPVRISFVPLDPDLPLEDQHGGRFDLILHKLTEDLLLSSSHALRMEEGGEGYDGSEDDEETKEQAMMAMKRVEALQRYKEQVNPDCCLVDDPVQVQTLLSRSDIATKLKKCLRDVRSASGIPVQAPRYLVVRHKHRHPLPASSIIDQLQDMNLRAPFMVKPLVAAGTKESHFMTIVLKESALNSCSTAQQPCIIQEYVNHDATLYKVYVLGAQIFVYERPSLPNLPRNYLEEDATVQSTSHEKIVDALHFDSQRRPYPTLAEFGITDLEKDEDSDVTSSPRHVQVNVDELRPVVESLRQAFGLELFGFDILWNANDKYFLVVDVNYFPSYKEVPNFPSLLAHYLTQRIWDARRQMTSGCTLAF